VKECDIQAPLREFYGFVQIIVVKTILIDQVMRPECRTHRYTLALDGSRNSTATITDWLQPL